MMKAITYKW